MLVAAIEIQRWPALLSPSKTNQVASHLGSIGDFKDIKLDSYFVEVLVHLWDPICSAFRLGKKEMTVTIEEVSGLLNLSNHGTTVCEDPKFSYFILFFWFN